MSEQEFLSGFCPKCGESLKVPAKLSQFSCMYCGARLTADELLDKPADSGSIAPEEALRVTESDGDWYVESSHPASKDNYISFVALVTGEMLLVLRQYPEWDLHVRIPGRPHGKLVWYSTTQGLFYQLV